MWSIRKQTKQCELIKIVVLLLSFTDEMQLVICDGMINHRFISDMALSHDSEYTID